VQIKTACEVKTGRERQALRQSGFSGRKKWPPTDCVLYLTIFTYEADVDSILSQNTKQAPFSHTISKVKMYTEGGMSGKWRTENQEGQTEDWKNVTWMRQRMEMIKQQEIWNAI